MTNKQVKRSSAIVTRRQVNAMIRSSRLANAEIKSFNISQVGINPAIAGTIYNITRAIVLGDGSNQRDGAQINLQEVHMRFNARTTLTSSVRAIIFSDNTSNGVAPAVADVLASTTFISAYNNIITNEEKRFTIHSDQVFDLSTNGVMNLTRTTTHKWRARKLTYLANTDVDAALGRNQVFLLIIGSTIIPFVDYDITVRFLDQ